MKTPAFWSHKGMVSAALLPASWLYRALSFLRLLTTQTYHSSVPVICVGNITSGGTGKTPVTSWLAGELKEQGYQPVILSRGYGGSLKGPIMVDPASHGAAACGDEPLLLAQTAPVMISANRAKGARAIEQMGRFDVIIMDDGMQNPQLHKHAIILVFDGVVGTQNGRIFPAGPLRQAFNPQKMKADFIIINGPDDTNLASAFPEDQVMSATLLPHPSHPKISHKTPVFAFAGIGRPARFFASLTEAGYQLAGTKAFGDHHPYQEAELQELWQEAKGANLITTQKDWVRLPAKWQKDIAYLPVSLHISETDSKRLVSGICQKF